MDKCNICNKPVVQLFETGKDGVYACFKCQPLVPEVTISDQVDDNEENNQQVSSNESQEQEDDGEMSLFCGICHKTFQKNSQLQNHLRHHRAERRFACTYCNKTFSQSNNLRAHLRIHTNERPYKCSECGKAFTQVTNLNNHVRLHTGERPFVCPEPGCNKAYAQVTNLNQHRKRHITGRPVELTYDCTICGQQFEQRNHMYTHRREAHMVAASRAAHACAQCDNAFPSERLLHAHARTHAADSASRDSSDDEHKSGSSGGGGGGALRCVFSSCGARVASARDHTEHLLRAHQLRVLATARPPKRGRPRKSMKSEEVDPLDISDYEEVKIVKESSTFLPKLKVQSLFQ